MQEIFKNSDGIPLEPPYEEDGRWCAEDGWGCVLDFDTYDEAVEFQRGLANRDGCEILFSDGD